MSNSKWELIAVTKAVSRELKKRRTASATGRVRGIIQIIRITTNLHRIEKNLRSNASLSLCTYIQNFVAKDSGVDVFSGIKINQSLCTFPHVAHVVPTPQLPFFFRNTDFKWC